MVGKGTRRKGSKMTYWLKDTASPNSQKTKPKDSSILIIGTGLAGVSAGYFLSKQGNVDVSLVDCGTENASYFRNAGHILHGASENYKAMSAIHGREKTKTIFQLSQLFCEQIKSTIQDLSISCDYHQGNYIFLAANEREEEELRESVEMMKEDGFTSSSMVENLSDYGFNSQYKVAKGCNISAQANPAKFRNHLLHHIIDQGINYHSYKVVDVEEINGRVEVTYFDGTKSRHDALIIAANAYSPLFSKFFSERKLIEPFKGQIIVSKPMKAKFQRSQFSADHGYIYGTITADNRLLIGGWRNNVPGGEVGTYDLLINPSVEQGLKQYVKDNTLFGDLEWEYSWAGIMGSSSSGFPHIGPTTSSLIFSCAGCTGYGFGWFHGSAKLIVDIILGNSLPAGSQLFDPRK
jgi:gamma-glutamylputrescine oxidase